MVGLLFIVYHMYCLQIVQYNVFPFKRGTVYWPTKGNGFKKQQTLIPGVVVRVRLRGATFPFN
jgi:hypothetical protein